MHSKIKVISRCLSEPDAKSLHHCLKNKQLKVICFPWICSKYLVLSTVEEGVANTCIWLTIHTVSWKSSKLWIERIWHIPNKSPFARLATGLVVSNACIQLNVVKY